MRLVRFNHGRIGILHDGLIYDAVTAIGLDPNCWPPIGMVQLIHDFGFLRSTLEAILKSGGIALADVRLEAPIVWPNKVIAYPVNYVEHGIERNVTLRADVNGFFLKANSSLSGPQDPIVLPDLPDREIHHECELAIIIGKTGRSISVSDALSYVFGYTCLIDVTVRGKEDRVMRKSYDTFSPIGPAIVTADEVGDPSSIELRLWVNDELRQHANTRDLILNVPNMISMASSVVIASGTPAGVGPIKAGDLVKIEIERIGHMTVAVIQGAGGDNLAIRKVMAQ
jgi:2-keto-4-pentenoate hydratase/2-oxohepta-3-ene-1,7-dioic acid hydratase in catechol pathway